jgi:GTP-binding protein
LTDKPEIVALSKADAMTPEAIKAQTAKLKKACKQTPLVLSAHSHEGVQEALRALLKVVAAAQESDPDGPAQKQLASQS